MIRKAAVFFQKNVETDSPCNIMIVTIYWLWKLQSLTDSNVTKKNKKFCRWLDFGTN